MDALTNLDLEVVLGALLALCAAGVAIAKLTKTDKDDKFFASALSFLTKFKAK